MKNTNQTYWKQDELSKIPVWDLQTMYANAKTTCGCLGHGKASANRRNAAMFYEELKRREIKPDGRDGYFNGPGSS